ncbi:MAG: ACT domain-containing protein [Candidatus Limnocylindria bacterium]
MHAFIVELPNRPGSLAKVTEAVAERGINITAVAGATSGELGSVSFTTDDESGTRNALGEKGWVYREVPLVHTSLEHRPGALAAAARKLADAGINVEVMFVSGMDGEKVEVSFGVDTPEAAQRALG